ncbi:E3 binding domain-containing protein, partial [Candidatus Puniceispirillum sp.]|nr:E3 binding domain-containing protein [Candidatus Puniceispirillum sp.]
MSIDIHVPTLGESVSDATIARWIKKAGETVAVDEPVVELETDKVTLEVPSPVAGRLDEIIAAEGDTVEVGALLARVTEGANGKADKQLMGKPAEPATSGAPAPTVPPAIVAPAPTFDLSSLSPAVRRLVEEHNLNPTTITPSGVGGRLTKADVLAAIKTPQPALPANTVGSGPKAANTPRSTPRDLDAAREERVPMSKLRQ